MATRNFKENDEICLYDGPMVYRIFNHLSGKYYVFSINNKGNDSFDNIRFLEKDTYVAWSGINVESAGRPAIELGLNCEQDIRFLNHSKEANSLNQKNLEKELDLPQEINSEVDQIIKTTKDIRIKKGLPANPDELMTALTPSQKKLLIIIFSDEESNVEDPAVDLSPRTIRTT